MNGPAVILVVDDHSLMTDVLADILLLKGFQVLSAHSGREALAILQARRVDVLLTDMVMPGMDGIALCRAARQIQPALLMILMTAYSDAAIIEQGKAEGVRAILDKPLEVETFLSLVDNGASALLT